MDNLFPSSIKWLTFTFFSTLLAFFLTGVSFISITTFSTGFIFSIGYLYKEQLVQKNIVKERNHG